MSIISTIFGLLLIVFVTIMTAYLIAHILMVASNIIKFILEEFLGWRIK